MTEDQFERWVTALEGDDFNQCRGALQKTGSYCCLGVLSVLEERKNPHGQLAYPRDLVHGSRMTRCMSWNDEEELTFPEIAGKLREQHDEFVTTE